MLHLSASKYLSNKLLFIDLLSKMADQLHRWALRKLLYDKRGEPSTHDPVDTLKRRGFCRLLSRESN